MPQNPPARPKGVGPVTWTDWTSAQAVDTTCIRPKHRKDLVEQLRAHDLRKLRVKAAGAGHSTSPVARPRSDGLLVQMDQAKLDSVAAARSWWKPEEDLKKLGWLTKGEHLVRVRAGASIRQVNDSLAKQRLGFPNLGSYDKQTVAGAISTATHGSGLATGPLCDLVVSVEMVCVVKDDESGEPEVKSYRIEPTDGPTEPDVFEAAASKHHLELIQDDEVFYSCVVSMGTFGIMTAVTLRVVDAFWLDEGRRVVPWERMLEKEIVQIAKTHDYFDAVIITYPGGDDPMDERNHGAIVTVRRKKKAPAEYRKRKDLPAREDARYRKSKRFAPANVKDTTELAECAVTLANMSFHGESAYTIARETFHEEADAHPLKPERRRWKSESYVVFRTSIGDNLIATSIEVAFHIDDTVRAVQAFLDHAAKMREKPNGYHYFSPIGVRFSQASEHLLAMQHGRPTCTIEIPLLIGTTALKGGEPSEAVIEKLLSSAEKLLTSTALGGRPHWGQRHSMTKAKAKRIYGDNWTRWMKQYRRFNCYGTFDNAFTEQMGISRGG